MEGNGIKPVRKKIDTLLTRTGLASGQRVLDFGCSEGIYTISAARIVGETGSVYALDKNGDSLEVLKREIQRERLLNVKPLHVEENGDIPLPPDSVDTVLLYDTLHGGYFPESSQRIEILRRIYRVLKPGGLLSCYPTHLKQYGITFSEIIGEITHVGFRFQNKHRRTLVHDGNIVRGKVFSFTKPPAAAGR